MAVGLPFTSAHVSALASRAAELEASGEELQDPHALMRAARLYKLAIRIADDIDEHPAATFTRGDLARVRDELRTLATDAVESGILGDYGLPGHATADNTGALTRAFREVAHRIEQRVVADEARPRHRSDVEPRA